MLTLINRAFKINSTWAGFHEELVKLKEIMLKNSYPGRVLDNIIKSKVNKLVCNEESNAKDERNTFYVKLPYIGKFSGITRQRINRILKRFCNDDFNIKLVFSSFKIRSLFGVKDPIPHGAQISCCL